MPEIVGTFVRAKTRDEGANSSMQSWDGPSSDLAEERLEFAEGHLDRVKVGGILRQIAKGRARGFDRPRGRRRLCGLEDYRSPRYRFASALARGNVQYRQGTFLRSSVRRTPSVKPSCRDEPRRRKEW